MTQRLARPAIIFIPFFLTACGGPYSTLDPASNAASDAAALWWGMFTFFTLVLVSVAGLWLYAVRRDTPENVPENNDNRFHNRLIIGGGILLPIASITVILAFGIPAGHNMLPLPPDKGKIVQIDVTGQQWYWTVRYPHTNIEFLNELHIPTDTPVDIHLRSADVIHSFWVPRLGGKLDAIPGKTNILRLSADKPGTYRGQCAEFCGPQHAHMKFTVTAHTPDDFETWLNARKTGKEQTQ